MLASHSVEPTMPITVVVPTLDEAESLARCLPELVDRFEEVIVSDGGSQDETVAIAQRCGARVVESDPGRGPQLNRGAEAARGDVLLFVHADTRLPSHAGEAIRDAIAHGAVGGAFTLRFDHDSALFRLGSALVNLRTRWLRIPLGDQAQFASRGAFETLEGFRPWPILEDLDFIRRLRRHGKIQILDGPALTSTRRYLHRGVLRSLATNYLIWTLWTFGVSPHRLAKLYRKVR
ncbi:MAG: TIGR04283 family arsenosugar biosynthesis glycosyltransferase [Acidobacteriota bacterium]